ncbi:hypothetical protein LPTSP4_08480 [Leptospira ryugenii]|uniref:DUF1232 domain-containing protein n=1 Tax=Leptospira ryugenii TaxID=1917863 RepID=A0A2P2DXH0_9LEPT|nr:YkvA family protein [Leptospira ryugenii]GBF49337.1 hypothetical protein LPTSP4_08480 [Leptospira ryugenii]
MKETYVKENFWKKVKEVGGKVPFLRDAIALYYCLLDESTSLTAKASIAFALAYFILPIDAIPDLFLVLGFTDDATIIASTIYMLQTQLKPIHYEKADAFMKPDGT